MSEWINVKDRIPDENVRVIVAGSGIVTEGILSCGSWWESGMDYEVYDVTHWMPLPEPASYVIKI